MEVLDCDKDFLTKWFPERFSKQILEISEPVRKLALAINKSGLRFERNPELICC